MMTVTAKILRCWARKKFTRLFLVARTKTTPLFDNCPRPRCLRNRFHSKSNFSCSLSAPNVLRLYLANFRLNKWLVVGWFLWTAPIKTVCNKDWHNFACRLPTDGCRSEKQMSCPIGDRGWSEKCSQPTSVAYRQDTAETRSLSTSPHNLSIKPCLRPTISRSSAKLTWNCEWRIACRRIVAQTVFLNEFTSFRTRSSQTRDTKHFVFSSLGFSSQCESYRHKLTNRRTAVCSTLGRITFGIRRTARCQERRAEQSRSRRTAL